MSAKFFRRWFTSTSHSTARLSSCCRASGFFCQTSEKYDINSEKFIELRARADDELSQRRLFVCSSQREISRISYHRLSRIPLSQRRNRLHVRKMHHRVKAIKNPKLSSLISALFADVLFSAAIYYFNLRIFRDICELSTSHDRPLKVSSQQRIKLRKRLKLDSRAEKSRENSSYFSSYFTLVQCARYTTSTALTAEIRCVRRVTLLLKISSIFHNFQALSATCYVYRHLARKTDDFDGQRARSDEMKIYF